MSDKKFSAGVKEYRQNYWMPDYVPLTPALNFLSLIPNLLSAESHKQNDAILNKTTLSFNDLLSSASLSSWKDYI